MDLLQLEHFLAVVEERTFTRAAERVGRTQPAISQSVKKLEGEMGAPLFARDLHDVSLTDAGKVLVEYARKMVRARDDAMRDVGALKTLKAGTLNIAAHESAAVYLLPAPLRTYLGQFPDVKVGIFRSRLSDIPRQVLDRDVDVGFVKDEPGFRELKSVDVHLDEMILVASPGHPVAARANVQAAIGLAIVPRITVAQELRDGSLVQIPVKELHIPRRTLMIYRDQGYLSEPARQLIRIVRSFNWDHRVAPMRHRPALRRRA